MATYQSAYTGAEIDTAINLVNRMWPVGSIYMSVNSTNPGTFLGGTWEEVAGRFLLGRDSSHAAGSTGGEETHTLTEAELPNITGQIYAGSGNEGASAGGYGAFRTGSGAFSTSGVRQYGRPASDAAWPSGAAAANINMSFGSNGAHNNMPPYLAVYIWKRTA